MITLVIFGFGNLEDEENKRWNGDTTSRDAMYRVRTNAMYHVRHLRTMADGPALCEAIYLTYQLKAKTLLLLGKHLRDKVIKSLEGTECGNGEIGANGYLLGAATRTCNACG